MAVAVSAVPPSILTESGIGYGPRSDSPAYSKVTRRFAVAAGAIVIGIPIGPPSQRPEPKSGWRWPEGPTDATICCELTATGSLSTRRFQALSAGNTGHPATVGVPT